MSKVLLILSFISLAIVSIGTAVAPQSLMFWLAAHNSTYEVIRILLASVLILQIASRPPRYLWFRVMTGFIAVCTALWVVVQTMAATMYALDSMSLLAASIAILVTSLEGHAVMPAAALPKSTKAS